MNSLLMTGLVQLLEHSINAVLRQDPHLLHSLNTVASNKRLRVVCMSAERELCQLTLIITAEKLHIHSNSQELADATVRGSKKALIGLLTSDDPAAALHHPELELEGDVHLIQMLHNTISNAGTRWDDVLAPLLKPIIGDTGAAIGTTAVNSGVEFVHHSSRTMQLTIKDFLQEESQLLPTRSETQLANSRLDNLRLRLDRLDARVGLLRQHVTN